MWYGFDLTKLSGICSYPYTETLSLSSRSRYPARRQRPFTGVLPVGSHFRIHRQSHHIRIASPRPAQFFGTILLPRYLPLLPCRSCMLRRTHARWPNGSGIPRRAAVSGEPQKLGGSKRVQLVSHPDESITSINDWPRDPVSQSISLPGPEREPYTHGQRLSIHHVECLFRPATSAAQRKCNGTAQCSAALAAHIPGEALDELPRGTTPPPSLTDKTPPLPVNKEGCAMPFDVTHNL